MCREIAKVLFSDCKSESQPFFLIQQHIFLQRHRFIFVGHKKDLIKKATIEFSMRNSIRRKGNQKILNNSASKGFHVTEEQRWLIEDTDLTNLSAVRLFLGDSNLRRIFADRLL